MADPLDKAAASALPTLGEGCLARFDPDAMSDEHGTELSVPPNSGGSSIRLLTAPALE